MAYTPPVGNAVILNLTGAYTPPGGGVVLLDLTGGTIVRSPLPCFRPTEEE